MAGEETALDTVAAADATPEKKLRRWLLEIKLAKKREKDWRLNAAQIIDVYRGKNRKKSSFNILWANTETLRPALYNSQPKPDVRRRFRQNDMLGKAVGEVMERSLTYCTDAYDLDNCLKADVLDGLLPGRGISRIRYVPKFKTSAAQASGSTGTDSPPTSPPEAAEPAEDEAFTGEREEVEYEQALCEHVQWDDFLHGAGKVWEEVQWIAFRHRLRRDDLIEQFGKEIGKAITLNDVADDDVTDKKQSREVQDVFKRAELWEVWDKESEEVFFVNDTYMKSVIYALAPEGIEAKPGEPPLKLRNFFPIPRPLVLVEDTGTLIPSPLYELYREQASELDRISYRINKVVNALKIRGVYDSTLSELSELMKGEDNTLVAVSQAKAWMTNGGFEKAIWWMPVQASAIVLKELYAARDACKQVIYELTGIADIIRGASDPNETLGAQKLKANSAGLRLQRMQREVQRYVRDLIRLMAEVIGENFDPQTLSQMTGLQFPTAMQKQQIQLQMQAIQQQTPPPQPGQPPAPPPPQLDSMQKALQMSSWEDIMAVLKSDMQREYRVDVETDSTVAESLQQDMTGLKEVLTGVVEFWKGVGPAVQAGAIDMEAVKAITMTIVRRARMGLEVEDALEAGMKPPKPTADPNAGKLAEAQAKMQLQQQEMQQQAQAQKEEGQRQVAVEVAKHQREMAEQQAEFAARSQELAQKHQSEMADIRAKHDTEMEKAQLQSDTQIIVAEIGASKQAGDVSGAEASANADLGGGSAAPKKPSTRARPKGPFDELSKMHGEQMAAHSQSMEAHGHVLKAIEGLAQVHSLPKRIVRDPVSGRATGVEVVRQ